MIDLELVNMKNAYPLHYEKLRRKIIHAEKKEVDGGKGVSEESTITINIVGDCTRIEK